MEAVDQVAPANKRTDQMRHALLVHRFYLCPKGLQYCQGNRFVHGKTHVQRGGDTMIFLAAAILLFVFTGNVILTLFFLLILTPEILLAQLIYLFIRELLRSD